MIRGFKKYIEILIHEGDGGIDHGNILISFINAELQFISEVIKPTQIQNDQAARTEEASTGQYVIRRGVVFGLGGTFRSNLKYIRFSEYIIHQLRIY